MGPDGGRAVNWAPMGACWRPEGGGLAARLADDALAAQVNSELVDLNIPINSDAEAAILTGDSPEGHAVLLHSCAHLMAQAVKSFWPEAKLTIGPTIENRFYYDFDVDFTFSEDDLL